MPCVQDVLLAVVEVWRAVRCDEPRVGLARGVFGGPEMHAVLFGAGEFEGAEEIVKHGAVHFSVFFPSLSGGR